MLQVPETYLSPMINTTNHVCVYMLDKNTNFMKVSTDIPK